MARRKTTIYVDDDLLRAAKVYAARNDLRDSDVVESALRRFLGLELLDAIWDRTSGIDEVSAEQIAYEQLARARSDRKGRSERPTRTEQPIANP